MGVNAVTIALVVSLLLPALALAEPAKPPTTKPAGELLKPGPDAPRRGDARPRDPRQAIFHTDVPDHPIDVVLSRIERDSVTVSVMVNRDADVRIDVEGRTVAVGAMAKGDVRHVLVDRLTADRAYAYRVLLNDQPGVEGTFHTARPPGAAFRFTVQADSHLDGATVPALYAQTLANVAADHPDFHFELGDTFMNDKYPSYRDALRQYVAQRYYFGLACRTVPFFFVIGNHDGEAGWRQGRDGEGMADWSRQTRKRYFANPFPDAFYTGNADPGRLEDYYAFEWGDGLFVALDPFAYTTAKTRGDGDGWNWTLGPAQYEWLRRTLDGSRARFKFVFLHHLVGGAGKDARGGVEAARNFEWGGNSADGKRDFATKRPGWAAPIHELLVKARVIAVFHGHDHLYARQSLDGITYVEVPQPSHPAGGDVARMAAEYGYREGKILGSPGHVRVSVTLRDATIEYVRSAIGGGVNAEVADTLRIEPTK